MDKNSRITYQLWPWWIIMCVCVCKEREKEKKKKKIGEVWEIWERKEAWRGDRPIYKRGKCTGEGQPRNTHSLERCFDVGMWSDDVYSYSPWFELISLYFPSIVLYFFGLYLAIPFTIYLHRILSSPILFSSLYNTFWPKDPVQNALDLSPDSPGNSRPLNMNCSTLPRATGLSYREKAGYKNSHRPDIVARADQSVVNQFFTIPFGWFLFRSN